MGRTDRNDAAIGVKGAHVSPYLRRPLRSYEQFLRDEAERLAAADSSTWPKNGTHPRKESEHVEPRS